MNSLARRSLLCVLLCACSGGPISDFPRPATDNGQNGGDGDGDGDSGDGDSSGDGDGDEFNVDAGVGQEPGANDGLDAGADAEVGDSGAVGQDGGDDAGAGALGTLSGELDVLDTELTSATPAFFINHFDLGTIDPRELSEADLERLTPGAQHMLEEGGFLTPLSELISYEVLARSEGAELLKLGHDIAYKSPAGERADYLVQIEGAKLGVTVARAESFPSDAEYMLEDATKLLENRLLEIAEASANVSTGDAWEKQILHILAYSEAHATVLQAAYAALDAHAKGNTIVIVTITDGDDAFLY